MNKIGDNIRRYRDLRQLSQEFMASQLNISQSSYAELENHETKLTVDRLLQIANLLELDVSLLLNSSNPTIFNLYDNQNANGKVENQYNNPPSDFIKQYQEQITHLKEEIVFLRNLVKL